MKSFEHKRSKETLHKFIKIFDLFGERSKFPLLTEIVPGPFVEKPYIYNFLLFTEVEGPRHPPILD